MPPAGRTAVARFGFAAGAVPVTSILLGCSRILDHSADRVGARCEVLGRTFGQAIERVELRRRNRTQRQVPLRERLDPRRTVELLPFRAQRCNLVALVAQFAAQPGKTLGLDRGIEFDAVDIGGGEDQEADHTEIEHAQDITPHLA